MMPLFVIGCYMCTEEARGISVKYPNPDSKDIGVRYKTLHFCSWDCLKKWAENQSSEQEEATS